MKSSSVSPSVCFFSFETILVRFNSLQFYVNLNFLMISVYLGCAGSFVAARAFSLVVASGSCSLVTACGLFPGVAPLIADHRFRRMRTSVAAAHGLSSRSAWALEHRLSSCSAQASLLHGTWGRPTWGVEPVFPALAGGFITAEPPGKLLVWILELHFQLLRSSARLFI